MAKRAFAIFLRSKVISFTLVLILHLMLIVLNQDGLRYPQSVFSINCLIKRNMNVLTYRLFIIAFFSLTDVLLPEETSRRVRLQVDLDPLHLVFT